MVGRIVLQAKVNRIERSEKEIRLLGAREIQEIRNLEILSKVFWVASQLNVFAMAMMPVLFPTLWWTMVVGGLGGIILFYIPQYKINQKIKNLKQEKAIRELAYELYFHNMQRKLPFTKSQRDLPAVDPRCRSDIRFKEAREKDRLPSRQSVKALIDGLDLAISPKHDLTLARHIACVENDRDSFSRLFQEEVREIREQLRAGASRASFEKAMTDIQIRAFKDNNPLLSEVVKERLAVFKEKEKMVRHLLQKDKKAYFAEVAKINQGQLITFKIKEAVLRVLQRGGKKLPEGPHFVYTITQGCERVDFEKSRSSFSNFATRYGTFKRLRKEVSELCGSLPFLKKDASDDLPLKKMDELEKSFSKMVIFLKEVKDNDDFDTIRKHPVQGLIEKLDFEAQTFSETMEKWLGQHVTRNKKAIDKFVDEIETAKRFKEFEKPFQPLLARIGSFDNKFGSLKMTREEYYNQIVAFRLFKREVEDFRNKVRALSSEEFWKATKEGCCGKTTPRTLFSCEKDLKAHEAEWLEKTKFAHIEKVLQKKDRLSLTQIQRRCQEALELHEAKWLKRAKLLHMERALQGKDPEAYQRIKALETKWKGDKKLGVPIELSHQSWIEKALKEKDPIAFDEINAIYEDKAHSLIRQGLSLEEVDKAKEKQAIEARYRVELAKALNKADKKEHSCIDALYKRELKPSELRWLEKRVFSKEVLVQKSRERKAIEMRPQTFMEKSLQKADQAYMRINIVRRLFDFVTALVSVFAVAFFYHTSWLFLGLATIGFLRTMGQEAISYFMAKKYGKVRELKMKEAKLRAFAPSFISEEMTKEQRAVHSKTASLISKYKEIASLPKKRLQAAQIRADVRKNFRVASAL